MGKGNRVRMAKANELAQSQSVFTAKKQKKGAPAWVSTVVIVLVLALLVSVVAVSVVTESGYALRSVKAAQSENYTVTGPMMSYYFYQTYNNFLNQYGSIISYMGLDTSLSLKTQTAMGSEDGQTWFDYFMDPTIEQVESMLIYCEEAKARGIVLDDQDHADIDAALAALDEAAAEYGYSTASYISALYGTGVKKADVRAALELSQLAAKCSEVLTDELTAAITDGEIDTYYTENSGDFLTATLLNYAFSTPKGDKDDATYKADSEKMKKLADELAACKTADEFKMYVLKYVANEEYDALYEKAAEDISIPAETDVTARRQQIIDACIANALEGKVAEKTTSEDAVEVMFSEIAEDLTDELTVELNAMLLEGFAWSDDQGNAAGLWASADDRKVGDTTVTEEDDTEENTDDENAGYTATAYMMLETMKRDETNTRNVGHILFTSSVYETDTAAEAKAEEIMAQFKAGAMTKDAFEALANEYTEDSGVFYENVYPGQMVSEFEDWMFDAERKEGDVDIVKTQYGYHLMYYLGENTDEPAWKAVAKNSILNEKLEAWYEQAGEKYAVTVDEKSVDKVNA